MDDLNERKTAQHARWRCPRCGPSSLAVERTRRRRTVVYYGGPCQCDAAAARQGEEFDDLAWRAEMEEVHSYGDSGLLRDDGSVDWHVLEEWVGFDDDATRELRHDRWCPGCADNENIEPEPSFEEDSERAWLDSTVTVSCTGCRAPVSVSQLVDDPKTTDLRVLLTAEA